MQKLHKHYSTQKTAQSQPIPGREKDMVKNAAGGHAFQVDMWKRLERFLILGTEGGTYYTKERALTVDNCRSVEACIREDGKRVVDTIIEISDAGRAPKNDPALFALAMCTGMGDAKTKRYALDELSKVARIGTHLFHFVEYMKAFRGWSRSNRRAIANWYNSMDPARLAYQVTKYQQRDGWSHADLLRLSHAKAPTEVHNAIYAWITDNSKHVQHDYPEDGMNDAMKKIWAFEEAKIAEKETRIIELIKDFNIPWETIPTKWLKSKDVWKALLPKLPLTALMRNLGRMSSIEVFKPLGKEQNLVVEKFMDQDYILKSRLHPMNILVALATYVRGEGLRGGLRWKPFQEICDALDKAFYLAFGNVEPTEKRTMLALDVSRSMGWSGIAGLPITPAVGASAMSLITASVEPTHYIMGFSNQFVDLGVSPRMRLDTVVQKIYNRTFGSTDCALPMVYATKNHLEVDTFIVYTDNETWYGLIHPMKALQKYRKVSGIPAKLIVVAMSATECSIADPKDAGSLDIVGFDTRVPHVITDFVKQ
jgi:60 kDa SS-A/Ro ribonucleoprotein